MTEKAKPLLAKLEFLVEGKTWSAGEKITISDFYLYMFVDLIKTQLNEEIFNGHSNLLRIHK
jgi:glutathione S-transferase